MFVDVFTGGEAPYADASSYYERGLACSVGETADLIEAHKWFNLAVLGGDRSAAAARSDVADSLTSSEILEAQRRARRYDPAQAS